jgi:osmotically-inducible protein OsmY
MSVDAKLQQDVLAELAWEPSVREASIGVSALDGVVTLTGNVPNYAGKHAAETAAWRVRGVRALADEIEVAVPFEHLRTDEDIAAAAVERLAWDPGVPSGMVKIRVENGWVTLTGDVDWHYQQEAAGNDVRTLLGVTGISNQTTVRPRANATDISHDIATAFRRSWMANPKAIKVTAEGGRIRLTGEVHTLHDWRLAGTTAWAAPGAASVQNDITIV